MNSDDDCSDLTEIESDEEYKAKPKKKTGPKAAKDGGYRIKNALKVPRATTYTAQALYDQMYSNDVNLQPEYQREFVWPETKQIGLIDSVFRNFYIPPIIFAVNSSDDGSETKTCIDGKQRLSSIHRFMDGFIPHKDPLTNEKLWYKEDVGSPSKNSRPRKILPEKYRRLFANKQIVCVEYHDINGDDEREIFQRVQLGMALTPAEKLQVINSPRAAFVRELQSKYLKEEGALAGEALEWDRSRGGDFRCLSQAVYCMEFYGTSLKTAGTIVKLERWLSEDVEFSASFRGKVHDAFNVFSGLVLDDKLNKVFKNPAKISPIEFVMISLLVAVHKDRMSNAQLANAVGEMRADVRDTHVDIRMNDRVAKTMLDFIRNAKGRAVAGDKGGAAGSGSGSGSGDKRKRTTASDEDDVKTKVRKASAPDIPKPAPAVPKAHVPQSYAASTSSVSTSTATGSNSSATASTTSTAPDRMAVLRAAKLAAQNTTQNLHLNTNPPLSLNTQSQSPHLVQSNGSNFSTPQLPSPGQTFTFPSSLNSYQHSQQQMQLQQSQPHPVSSPLFIPPHAASHSPVTPQDGALLAQMMRSHATAAVATNPSQYPNGSSSLSHPLPPPPRSAPSDRDMDRDWDRPYPSSSSRDRGRALSRTHTRDDDYSSRDRHRRSSGSGSGFGRSDSRGWGARGR